MTPAALVADLQARGVTLEPRGDKLRVRPISKVTQDELDTLRRLKGEVLRLLSPLAWPGGTPAAGAPTLDPIAAYTSTLGQLWSLNVPGATGDPADAGRLLDDQARQCDELGPEFAEAISREAARAWAARHGRCPYCGLEGVYHDPDTGEETALAAAGRDVKAGPVAPLDASRWPEALPGLGPHRPGPFTPCSTCGAGTFAAFGEMPLCRRCARSRGRRER